MTSDASLADLERSARIYPAYLFFQKASYWGPIFFLYFNSVLQLADVLLLESIYYVSVVILEIPTGYLSDRFGPRRILILSSLSQIMACAAFASSGVFAILAVGQVLLALGMALGSGSDTSYHYAILKATGRDSEYGDREGRASQALLLSQATSALIGGAVAIVDLRLAYILTLASSLVAAGLASRFAEIRPAVRDKGSMKRQIRACLGDATHPRLAWLTGYFIYMTVINHIPHEFYQPFLQNLIHQIQFSPATPAVTGIHTAMTMGVAAIAASSTIRMRDKLGSTPTLLLAGLIQTLIIAGMAWIQSPAIAILMVLRSVPRGLMQATFNAEVVPLVGETRRATYLSIQSLLGRLAFGAILFTFSSVFAGNEIAAPIRVSTIGAAVGLILLTAVLPMLKRRKSPQ
jgi:MFS family permease